MFLICMWSNKAAAATTILNVSHVQSISKRILLLLLLPRELMNAEKSKECVLTSWGQENRYKKKTKKKKTIVLDRLHSCSSSP